ncbi:MAG TPA: helix-turn-helix domain-containing protein [Solirubrobacterales bacterium]|nr:helix-turn-helix domain-containing protein [Solirubrobacterales bacterium]
MGVIGDTLSEARTRRGVDLDEVHAATGIRPRYLRAIEQEDWDGLPEEFYIRSFIRKYAEFLGVDSEPLVAEYRRQRDPTGGLGDAPTSPFARTSSRRAEALRRRRARQGVYAWLGGIAALVVIVVVVILLVSGGGEEAKEAGGGGATKGTTKSKNQAQQQNGGQGKGHSKQASRQAVALKIEPTAEVWACVLDARGKPLVDGAILAAGETTGPFHSRSYTAAFGNGSVEVFVDGKRAQTSSAPSPMGFTVDRHGKLSELPEGERPSCE